MKRLLTGNAAAAWAARLAGVDYVAAFPITPQTEIIETLAAWVDKGDMPATLTTLDSEHSMLTAAGAAAATGVRVFTATSSQGLLYAMEMLYTVAGWRVPLVLANVSRGLSAPITLESDHCDVLATRDSGFLQLHAASCQEVLDLGLIAHRLSEDERIRLPVLVNQDGFTLSFTREPVELPDADVAYDFVGPLRPGALRFVGGQPVSQAVAVLGGSAYSYFRYQMHLASLNGLDVFEQLCAEFAEHTGRRHGSVERYQMDDAELAFVITGASSSKTKLAVDRLRADGVRAGLLRPVLLRPFPAEALCAALTDVQAVVVIDQNISLGKGGVLYCELASALYRAPNAPLMLSFIGGLGGRDIPLSELAAMARSAQEATERGSAPPPRLLYTEDELKELRKLQAIASLQRPQESPP